MFMNLQLKFNTKVSLLIKLIDARTYQAPIDRAMTMYIEQIMQKPIYKQEGYVVFTKLDDGKYDFYLESSIYENQHLQLEVIDGQEMNIHMLLIPRSNYPFPRGTTLVRGKLIDAQDQPVSGQLVQARLTEKSSAKGRLTKDVKKEETRLSLQYVNGMIQVGQLFLLVSGSSEDEDNGKENKAETIQVLDVSEDGKREIVLQKPLGFQHKKGSLLFPLTRVYSSTKGEVAIFFSAGRSKTYDAQFFIGDGPTSYVKEVRLEEGSMLNLGVISLAD